MTPRKLTSSDSPQDVNPVILQDTDQDIKTEISDYLKDYNEDIIPKSESSKKVSLAQASSIMERIARIKDISKKTATLAVVELFRKGAANAGAPDSMEVEVRCPITGVTTSITRYDVVMALQSVTDHKTLRKLAETLAPQMLDANLQLIQQNPLMDRKGDLANRINRKLVLRKEDPLTRKEEVCCATYAQWMPNLNELAESTRLKALLDEDLNARRKRKNKPSQSGLTGNEPVKPGKPGKRGKGGKNKTEGNDPNA